MIQKAKTVFALLISWFFYELDGEKKESTRLNGKRYPKRKEIGILKRVNIYLFLNLNLILCDLVFKNLMMDLTWECASDDERIFRSFFARTCWCSWQRSWVNKTDCVLWSDWFKLYWYSIWFCDVNDFTGEQSLCELQRWLR